MSHTLTRSLGIVERRGARPSAAATSFLAPEQRVGLALTLEVFGVSNGLNQCLPRFVVGYAWHMQFGTRGETPLKPLQSIHGDKPNLH